MPNKQTDNPPLDRGFFCAYNMIKKNIRLQ